ncbi:MAG TPA: hypothetical protein VF059_10655 [Casimicrobiaceae bacterium]
MRGIISVADDLEADPLADPDAAGAFWRTIEGRGAVGAVQAICDAIAQLIARREPRVDGLRALLALDRHAQLLLEQQLLEFASAPLDAAAKAQQVRHAVFELARAFASAYLHVLEHVRAKRLRSAWIDGMPALLVRLLYHRQVELLLHLLRYEAWPHGRWRELHDAYRFAQQIAPAAPAERADDAPSPVTGADMYVRILLTQLLDTGQFLGPELAVARKWIGRWSRLVSLRRLAAADITARSPGGFVVDPAGGRGLQRPSSRHQGECLWLDTTPIAHAIDEEMSRLRDGAPDSHPRRVALLARLKTAFAPVPVRVERRGERKTVALMSVQMTAGGLGSIFAMLRDEWRQRVQARASRAAGVDDVSIMGAPSPLPGTALAGVADESLSAFPPTASFGVPQPAWQVCDRSASGSRLRGRMSNPRRVIPGSLVAFRSDEQAAWTLAVVRRLKRLPGSNVEIGVEHLACSTQPIVLTQLGAAAAGPASFPALYLRESTMDVNSRIRTLIVPASQFDPGRAFVMSSAKAEVPIRLKGALEYQSDFVWTTFDVLASASSTRAGEAPTGGSPPASPPPA